MKKVAEEIEQRRFDDAQVSGYYLHKALSSIAENPGRELGLLMARLSALLNDFEATTYSNYYFSKEQSPLLSWLPSFRFLLPLALLGIICASGFVRFELLAPILGSAISIFLFFYLSRLRMPMIPFLAIYWGHGLSVLLDFIDRRKFSSAAMSIVLCVSAFCVSSSFRASRNSANEWNKLGVVYKLQKNALEAERAFHRAAQEDPSNLNSLRNLAALYRSTGAIEKAEVLERQIKASEAEHPEGQKFESDLNGSAASF